MQYIAYYNFKLVSDSVIYIPTFDIQSLAEYSLCQYRYINSLVNYFN